MMSQGNAAGGPVLRSIFWRVGVPVAAVLGGFVGGYVILPWGLVTPFFIVGPLAVGFGAFLAALGAGWVGTLFSPDRTRTNLLPVVLVSGVTAVLAVAVVAVPAPMIFRLALGTIIIALGVSWATWRFRGPRERMGRDAAMTLALAVGVLLLSLLVLDGSVIRSVFGALSGVVAIPLGILSGVAAVVLSVILARGRFRGQGGVMGRDAAVTLGLVGLPAPIFFGAYYLASAFGLTSG